MVTIIYGGTATDAGGAVTDGEALWLPPADLRAATGWELKPEGMCREEVCIPIPEARAVEFLKPRGAETLVNLTAFADYAGHPYARDDAQTVWSFGEPAQDVRAQLLSLEAPDFTLPGYHGGTHSLRDQRGKKVLLLLWASW
jgi:hypothetical protein